MSWVKTGEDDITAPKALTGERTERVSDGWGNLVDKKVRPSTDGVVQAKFHHWKHHCGARACTRGESPPQKCGKCGQ